jgi:hypothetical protein
MTVKKVFIAVPAYDSKVHALCMASVFGSIENLRSHRVEATFGFQLGDPYIEMARNHLVKTFLSTDCTDMIFVDSDLAFDVDGMWKLMRQDVDLIGGAYPFRAQDKNDYPINVKLDENNTPIADIENGIIECNFVPTGFMRISRSVFELLDKKYPENIDNNGESLHFRTGFLVGNDKRWWGEDVYFCKICSDAGIKIWVDPSITFIHHGTLLKKGKYQEFLANGGKWPENK